jgi:hypothetical protein
VQSTRHYVLGTGLILALKLNATLKSKTEVLHEVL